MSLTDADLDAFARKLVERVVERHRPMIVYAATPEARIGCLCGWNMDGAHFSSAWDQHVADPQQVQAMIAEAKDQKDVIPSAPPDRPL